MIDGLKPYPDYRHSGDRWLQEVPSSWEKVRIKYLLREIDRRTQTGEEPLLSMRRDHGLVPLSQFSDKVAEPKALLAYKLVERGELVVNRMQAGNGLVFVARIPGLISPDYAIFRPVREVNLDYLELLFRSYPMRAKFRSESTGLGTGTAGFLRLYGDSLGAIEIGLPSEEEQSGIVRFLGHADRQIRRYIRTKNRLITLLNEQEEAIIHSAATHRSNPNVPLKPSGVEWLGDVPKDWRVVRFGRLVALTTGFAFKSEGFSQSDSDIRLLRGINLAPGRVRWDSVVRWPMSDVHLYADFELRPGDLVLGMDRPIVRGGVRVAEVKTEDVPALLLQRVARIRPREELDASFALLLLKGRTFSDYMAPIFTGISVPHISPDQIREFRVALPTKTEQTTIVRFLREATADISEAVDRARRETSLIREYRARLVAEVVTGKLDVREAAKQCPKEPMAVEEEFPVDEVDDVDAVEVREAETTV